MFNELWIAFYINDWEKLISITVDGLMPNEVIETRKLLAYENGVSLDDITIKIEN